MKTMSFLPALLLLLLCHTLISQITPAPDSIPAGQYVVWNESQIILVVDSLVIGTGATLEISNAIVYFKYSADPEKKARIIVKGNLMASNCIFTSERDDSEGDNNGDGMQTIPRDGDWGCIYFEGTDAANQSLSNCVFKYGGGVRYARHYIDVENAMIYQHWRDGYLSASQLSISHSKGTGIVMDYAYLSNSTISYCEDGIRCISDWVNLGENMVVVNNRRFPLLFDKCFLWDVPLSEETVYGNGVNGIGIRGLVIGLRSIFGTPLHITYASQLPLYIAENVELKNIRLTLVPGTRVRFMVNSGNSQKVSLIVGQHSVLEASATEDNRITFTSANDTSASGEELGQAYTADWGYIIGSRMSFSYCDFKYGGVYYDPQKGVIDQERSAVLQLEEKYGDTSHVSVANCNFRALYRNGIYSSLRTENQSGKPHINYSSFELPNVEYGIQCANTTPEEFVDGTYNYWNSKTGPYHPTLNPVGNGCMVGNGIQFLPFNTASADSQSVVVSGLRGKVRDNQGVVIENAKIWLNGRKVYEAFTDVEGNYAIRGIEPGFGYGISAFAKDHHPYDTSNLMIYADTVQIMDFVLTKRQAEFEIDTLNFNINPLVSKIGINGTVSRYYKVVTKNTHEAAYGVKIFIDHDTSLAFLSDETGIVTFSIASSRVGGVGSKKTFYVTQIGENSRELTPEERIPFTVEIVPYSYLKSWAGEAYIGAGIFSVQTEKRRGSSLEMLFKMGTDTIPDSLFIYRKSQNGIGLNQGVGAGIQMGDFYSGAEAEVGVNMFKIMEDEFKFDYNPGKNKLALAQFIVLADGMLPYMDGPLMRMFVRCLEQQNTEIRKAAVRNTLGCRINAYGTASGGIVLPENPLDINMNASGSINGEANSTFRYSNYEHSSRTDFSLALNYEASSSAAFAADFGMLGMIRGLGSESNPNPVHADASAKVHGDMELGTAKNMDSPFSWLTLGYGYEYDLSANLFDLQDDTKRNIENYYTFYFRDSSMNDILKNSSQIAKTFLSPFTGQMDLASSSEAIGDAFTKTFNTVSIRQKIDPLYQVELPYEKTVHEEFSKGGFDFNVSFGISVLSVKFGAGFNYTGLYKYPEERGVFYDYTLYPLEEYNPLGPDDLQAKEVVIGIISNGVGYVWEEIKDDLNPVKFFKRVAGRIKGWFTKSSEELVLVIGPESRPSSISFSRPSKVMSGTTEPDSIYAYYWEWYGTGETTGNQLKSTNPTLLRIQNYVRERATKIHKLDYGIGGFYQFEPYNAIVTDQGALLKLRYHDEDLTVILNDSSLFEIPENELRVYKEDKVNNKWVYLGGQVDTDSNYVTLVVDTLGTFTLAPFAPSGTFTLKSDPDTIRLEVDNNARLSSSTIYGDNGDPLMDGELFMVEINSGTITSIDASPELPGVQVASTGGRIGLWYEADSLSGVAAIKVTSMKGNATGFIQIPVVDGMAPGHPVLDTAYVDGNSVVISWTAPIDQDLTGFKVYYDTVTGGPYNGTASVVGEPSPVLVGNFASTILKGLKKGTYYYFAVTAIDRCRNESGFSNEFKLKSAFNIQPELFNQQCEVAYDAPNGTIVDTLEASDADKDQVLTYYLADGNTCDVFRIDPATGTIFVDKTEKLAALQADSTFEVRVGVRDNGEIPLSDYAMIHILANLPTHLEYPTHGPAGFEINPNPAINRLNVRFFGKDVASNGKMMILNPKGEVIFSKEYRGNFPENEILDISGIAPGVYVIVVQTREGRSAKKLVIQR